MVAEASHPSPPGKVAPQGPGDKQESSAVASSETTSSGTTSIPAQARVAAGLALAVYILTHPILCWDWLRDPTHLRRFRFIEYSASLALLAALAGFLRSVTLGVYVPVYGQWRMPIFDALSYYLIMGGWMVGVVLGCSWFIRKLADSFGGALDDTLSTGVAFFSLTPFLLSGLLVLIPFDLPRTLLSIGVLYSPYLFAQAVMKLSLVPPGRRALFWICTIFSTYAFARLSLGICMSLFMPSYPALAPSSPPVSVDVIEFQENLEGLAEAFSRG